MLTNFDVGYEISEDKSMRSQTSAPSKGTLLHTLEKYIKN